MWRSGWRDELWSHLHQPWDMIIIGGGITGAGILRRAARAGLSVLLVEQGDFASGTSSRSSKLVHGGLRYLRQRQVGLTFEAVRERDRLLREGSGLVTRLPFLFPVFADQRVSLRVLGLGLAIFDLMALKWAHRYCDPAESLKLYPPLKPDGLRGGYQYYDAVTDDARLVLRLIREGVAAGGAALNYARAAGLLRSASGEVRGVALLDVAPGSNRQAEVQSPIVINASGPWADDLRAEVGGQRRLRPLRGSHLIFPGHRLPAGIAANLLHPTDGRPVFIVPWEGVVIFGTTDLDHESGALDSPSIHPEEVDYLLAALAYGLPSLELTRNDVMATYAGVRPVIDTGKANPSRESREHAAWEESGLLTITGGKLTTFDRMAAETLRLLRGRLPSGARTDRRRRALNAVPEDALTELELSSETRGRLLGRYGAEAAAMAQAGSGELSAVGGTPTLWAEIRWAARAEGVVHLDDLLLRRVRLGLLLPKGGKDLLPEIRHIAQPELGWSDDRWQREEEDYFKLWEEEHGVGQ